MFNVQSRNRRCRPYPHPSLIGVDHKGVGRADGGGASEVGGGGDRESVEVLECASDRKALGYSEVSINGRGGFDEYASC